MRRAVALSSLLIAGCATGSTDVGGAAPVFDAAGDTTTRDGIADAADETPDPDAPDAAVSDALAETADETSDSGLFDVVLPDTELPDTAPVDSGPADTGPADAGPVDAGPPWKHTVIVDGVNDFSPQEKFQTTSTGYDAYVTWDDAYLYVGYSGPDIGISPSAEKWVFVYVDVDPGAATGPASAERYNTQAPRFPTGFGAEFYMRFRTDNTDASIKRWDASSASWAFVTTMATRQRLGNFVELRIPRSTLGTSTQFGLVSFMMNERPGGEWTYAGLYADNFVDGYASAKVLTKYLLIDTTSAAPPNSSSRIKP